MFLLSFLPLSGSTQRPPAKQHRSQPYLLLLCILRQGLNRLGWAKNFKLSADYLGLCVFFFIYYHFIFRHKTFLKKKTVSIWKTLPSLAKYLSRSLSFPVVNIPPGQGGLPECIHSPVV